MQYLNLNLPDYEAIPDEFKADGGTIWRQLVSDWYHHGLAQLGLRPHEGVDAPTIVAVVRYHLTSDIELEHRIAGTAYLMAQCFEDAMWVTRPFEADVAEPMEAAEA